MVLVSHRTAVKLCFGVDMQRIGLVVVGQYVGFWHGFNPLFGYAIQMLYPILVSSRSELWGQLAGNNLDMH
jgi:hypothetical protein